MTLLNPNQQRRLGVHPRLLADDLDGVRALPELARPGAPPECARVLALAAEARTLVDETRRALGLPAERVERLRTLLEALADAGAALPDGDDA